MPDYDELVLVANSDQLDDDQARNDLRLFLSATARGADSARKNPGRAADALRKANRDLVPKLLNASVKATIPALFPEQRVALGLPRPGQVALLRRLDAAERVDLRRRPMSRRWRPTSLLPGEGL